MNRYADLSLIITGSFLVSMKGILLKYIYADGISVDTALMLRAWVSLPFIWAWALYHSGAKEILSVPKHLMGGALLAGAVCYYLAAYINFFALTLIDASLERVLLFSYPVLVVIARAIGQRKWPSSRVLVSVTMIYVGIIFAVGGFNVALWEQNGLGSLLVLCSAIGFSYYLIANERFTRTCSSSVFIVYTTLAAAVFLLIHAMVFNEIGDFDVSQKGWTLILILTLFTNVLPLFLFSAAIRRIGAQRAAIVSSIGPVATIAIAAILLGESMAPVQIFGSALIVIGIVVLEVRNAAKPEISEKIAA